MSKENINDDNKQIVYLYMKQICKKRV